MKHRLLVDTNVVLDVLLDRKPHVTASAAICSAIENGKAEGFLAAHAVTTIHYLLCRELGSGRTTQSLRALLRIFAVAPVDSKVIEQALQTPGQDFEDSVTACAAQAAGCHWIVTRDPKGFKGSAVRALAPLQAISLLR